MYQIDTVDIEIVNLLMEDGRLSAAVIARKIGGISERAVRYRIEKMVEDGIIRISAIVNPKSLGFFVVADVMLEVEYLTHSRSSSTHDPLRVCQLRGICNW